MAMSTTALTPAPDLDLSNAPNPNSSLLSMSRAIQIEREVIEYTDRLYELATQDRDRDREIRETMKTIDFLDGKQWDAGARVGRNRPVINKMRRHYIENVGLLTDLAIDFSVKMFDRMNEFNDLEAILNQLATMWARQNQFEDRMYDVILYGLLHTGPAKIQWNSSLHNNMGDVDLVPIAPWQWSTLGAGTNPQDAECILYFPVVTKDHLIRRFGDVAKRVECDMEYGGALGGGFNRPAHISKDAWARYAPALRASLGVKQSLAASDSLYPMVTCKEFWLRDPAKNETSSTRLVGRPGTNWCYMVEPGDFLYPRGRVIVQAGGVVLEDTCNPYWHAKFPFPVFRPFRMPWQMSGSPMMKSWMQMQRVINTLMGGMLDYLCAVNEPTMVAPKGAFPPGDWDSLDPGAPGGKIKYNNNAPKAPEFMKRAELPVAANMQYLAEINREFDMSSGASAMQQALGKKQVPGGDSLEMILSSRSLPTKVESRALGSFIEEGGEMIVANMLQFYSVQHRVTKLGMGGLSASDWRPIYGESLPAGMKPEDFVRKFPVTVRKDTLLRSQKEAKIQYAIALSKMGKISDKKLFQALDDNFPYAENRKELLEEARTKLLLAAAAAAVQGKGQKGGKGGGAK